MEVGLSGPGLEGVIECLSCIFPAVYIHGEEVSVFIHGDTSVIQQITVVYPVHAALGVEEADMLLQLLTVGEGRNEPLHHFFLLGSEAVGVCGVYGREVTALQAVCLSAQLYGASAVVDAGEQQPVIHEKLGMPLYQLALQLHLYHEDGLVHHLVHAHVVAVVFLAGPDGEGSAVRILVLLHGEGHEGHQVDAVTLLQSGEVGVAYGQTYDGGYGDGMPGGCRHPYDVVIAPFDVDGVVLHQGIHDDMGSGSSVIYIPDYVEMVYHEPLYEIGESGYELRCLLQPYDGGDDGVVVALLVLYLCLLGDQLFDDVCEVSRKGLPYLGAGVFRCYSSCESHETMEGDPVPVVYVLLFLFDERELFFGIVDEGGEALLVAECESIAELLVDLAPD